MSGTLYITGTPIGNLGDISTRVAQTLEAVDFIAAEDSRVTLKLLSHLGLHKPVVSYHEHNKASAGKAIVERLQNGESCAIVTDAGMPAISDPGCDLVALCRTAGVGITVVPGASAVVCAMALSGFADRRFSFEGFLPADGSERASALQRAAQYEGCAVFYEAPHRLKKTLCALRDAFGADTAAAVIKEITKIYENTDVTTLGKAAENAAYDEPKGEFVIVVQSRPVAGDIAADALEMAKELTEMGVSASDAARYAAKKTGAKKNEIYRALI